MHWLTRSLPLTLSWTQTWPVADGAAMAAGAAMPKIAPVSVRTAAMRFMRGFSSPEWLWTLPTTGPVPNPRALVKNYFRQLLGSLGM